MKNSYYLLFLGLLFFPFYLHAEEIKLMSPDRKAELVISIDEAVSARLLSGSEQLMEVKNISMLTDKGSYPSSKPQVKKVKKNTVDRMVIPEVKEKRASIPEKYSEVLIEFKDKVSLEFRLYNDGMAYRFVTGQKGNLTVKKEFADFVFDPSSRLTFQQDANPNSDYEAPYVTKKIEELAAGDMGNLPALVQCPSGKSVLFLESDTKDYPCMWLKKGTQNLSASFWEYPKEYNVKGNPKNRRQTLSSEDYIAKTVASRTFPWRVFATGDKDTDLLTNQLVYLLAPPCKIADPSWIHSGWVTFDWWARRSLYNVDFKSGINMETAKYMIDFASDFGIRYFLFDDGWTKGEDLTQAIPALDMKEVVRYARSKNVDVMLWIVYSLFDEQMETALKQFKEWGVKGIKIDFMNRSDQEMVNFYWRAAEACARYEMVIDFHGAYRPDGLRRAYPNVLTREALIEFEYNGGKDYDSPDHHCTLPFIRNVAGPMDYIPGTMNNATKREFRNNHDHPMGQGTRAHSMALAVITESPMQMLPDPQSDYYRERECTEFLTKIPVEWDDILPIDGKVGDYVTLARKKGANWYVASITDWTPRKVTLNFDFLDDNQTYTMEFFKDGPNADIRGIDYKKETRKVRKGDQIDLSLVSGGGWVAGIFPDKN